DRSLRLHDLDDAFGDDDASRQIADAKAPSLRVERQGEARLLDVEHVDPNPLLEDAAQIDVEEDVVDVGDLLGARRVLEETHILRNQPAKSPQSQLPDIDMVAPIGEF